MSKINSLDHIHAIRVLFEANRVAEAEQQIQSEIVALLDLAAEHYHAATLLARAYEYAKALMMLYPTRTNGYLWSMRALLESRRFDDAAKICQRAVENCSHDSSLCVRLIQAVYGLGLYEEALQVALLLIQKQPLGLEHYLLAAQSFVALERFDEARHTLLQGSDALPQAAGWLASQIGYLDLTSSAYQERQSYPLYDLWRCAYQYKSHQLEPRAVGRPAETDLIPIQYWSQDDPPADVLALTAEWNTIFGKLGLPHIRLFNKQMARDWIASASPQFLAAFDTAPHFSSESDVFRIAFATRHSSIYIDSDMYPAAHALLTLSRMLSQRASGLYVYRPTPYLQNSFFISRLGCPFFARIAERLAGFDYRDESLAGYSMFELIHDHSFGPGIFNIVLRSFCDVERPRHRWEPTYPLVQVLEFQDFALQFCTDDSFGMSKPGLKYKGSDCSWQVWSRKQLQG